MTNFRYKVTGPRGATYLTETLAEAKELTRNGGSYRRIGEGVKRNPKGGGAGRPRNSGRVVAGDRYVVSRGWWTPDTGDVQPGDTVEVLNVTSPTRVEYLHASSGAIGEMLTSALLDRVSGRATHHNPPPGGFKADPKEGKWSRKLPEVEDAETLAQDVAGGGKEGVAALATLVVQQFEAAQLNARIVLADTANEIASIKSNYRDARDISPEDNKRIKMLEIEGQRAKWHAFNQVVRRTGRYLLKQMLQFEAGTPRFNFARGATIWTCAVVAMLRDVMLSQGIPDYEDIYSKEDIEKAAKLVAEWFYSKMESGELTAEGFNIFGNVKVWKDEDGNWQFEANRGSPGDEEEIYIIDSVDLSDDPELVENPAPWYPKGVMGERPLLYANPSRHYRGPILRNPTDEEVAVVDGQVQFLRNLLENIPAVRDKLGKDFIDTILKSRKAKLLAKYETEEPTPEYDEEEDEEGVEDDGVEEIEAGDVDIEEEVPQEPLLPISLEEAESFGPAKMFEKIATNDILRDYYMDSAPENQKENVKDLLDSYERVLAEPNTDQIIAGFARMAVKGAALLNMTEEMQLAQLAMMPAQAKYTIGGKVNWAMPVSAYANSEAAANSFLRKLRKERILEKGVPVKVAQLLSSAGEPLVGEVKVFLPVDVFDGNEYEAREAILPAIRAAFGEEGYKTDKWSPAHGGLEGPGYVAKKVSPGKLANFEEALKERKAKLVKEGPLELYDIPEGYDDMAFIDFVDITDRNKWGYPAESQSSKEAFFTFSGLPYGASGDILRTVIPSPDQMRWVSENAYTNYNAPWERNAAWNMRNVTEKDYNKLLEKLEGAKIYVKVTGTPKFGFDVTKEENRVPLTIKRSGSNIAIWVPESYKNYPVIMPDSGARTNVHDAAVRALLDQGAYDQRADPDNNIKRHFVIKYTEFPSKFAPVLKQVPGVSGKNIDEMSETLRKEIFERTRLLRWSKTAPLKMGKFHGKWQGLKWFQEEGVRFLMGRKTAVLADDRGLGKTIQSIVAADTVVPPDETILVITPAKLTSNYWKEIQTFALNKRAYILTTQGKSDKADIKKKEMREIGIFLRNVLAEGESDEYLESQVERLGKSDYVVNGKYVDYEKARQAIYNRAIANGVPIAPVEVDYIPKDARWVIVSAETAAGKEKVVGRITIYKDADLPSLGMSPESTQYLLATSLPESGKLLTYGDVAKRFVEKMKEYVAQKGSAAPESYVQFLSLDPKQQRRQVDMGLSALEGKRIIRKTVRDGKIREVIFSHAEGRPDKKWPLTIFDEAHKYKNASPPSGPSGLFLFARAMSEASEKVWFLTGTPIANRVIDLWSLLNLTGHKEGYGVNYIPFGEEYAAGKREGTPPRWQFKGATNMDKLKRETSDVMLWRYKDDVTDIPVQQVYPKYLGMGDDMSALRDWTYEDAPNKRQLLGEIQTKMGEISQWKAPYSAREALFAVSEGRKTIVFTLSIASYDIIKEELLKYQRENPWFKFVDVRGDTPAKKVREAVKQFTEDEDTMLFLGQTAAAGTGLNLQAANYTVFNDLYWSPFLHEQAEDRTRRIGQQACTTVVYMLSDAWLDGKVWSFMNQKRDVIEKLQEGRDDPEAFADDFIQQAAEEQGIPLDELKKYQKAADEEAKRLEKLREELQGDDD